MKKKNRTKNPDRDLDRDANDYQPTDSDDDYDDNEKLLLERAKKGKSFAAESDDDDDDTDDEEGVLDVYSSSDEDEEGNKQTDKGIEDSDIEGMEEDDGLPDVKAWGKRKKNYYHNDYSVDDTVGFSKEAEEEQALMEEKEARTLQMKLASQMEDVDLLGAISKSDKSKLKEEEASSDESDEEAFNIEDEMIKQDLSKLTKREKLALLQKQSPEFLGLVGDFKERLKFVMYTLMPVSKLIQCGHISHESPASRFVSMKTTVSLNYCINLIFYLLLKKKGIDIKGHPVTERILAFRKTLEQLDALQNQELLDQLKQIIEVHKNVDDLNSCSCDFGSKEPVKQKKMLKLLSNTVDHATSDKRTLPQNGEENKKKLRFEGDEETPSSKNREMKNKKEEIEEEEEIEYEGDLDDGKRAITYEMAKNKGLTPRRKKELRNPRVKNRNKYRKALIRRKGQVRNVIPETSKYSGEVFGIKASVIKSKKLK